MKKEPQAIIQNMKDAHFNTIGDEFIITSMNKKAYIIRRVNGETEKELDLKKREMSSSLVCNNKLYVGTYVDTIFIFSIPNFEPIQLVRTHESVLSMCTIDEKNEMIAVGQAGGYVDIILYKSDKTPINEKKSVSKFINFSHIYVR